ncbi:MAG: heavy-metal-associated domain-containing protein [Clostridia bacterium]|nr:heavy-metal-associated domain-containing protein [Clostridia bacterium]
MNLITVKIEGMMCGMCEAHVCDAIRRYYPNAKKVKASRTRRMLSFVIDEPVDIGKLETVINNTGYSFISAESEVYKKKSIFG